MKKMFGVTVGAALMMIPALSAAQVQNEGLANGVVAARQKNAALLGQYNWNCRTQVTQNGSMQDLRVDLVSLGPDGQPQKTLLNDQPGQLPGGFFRHAIAENQRKQLEQYVAGVGKLVDQYTLPGGGKVVEFLSTASVQPVTTPQGTTILQVSGTGVVVPGDTFSMSVDGHSLLPTGVQISTTYNGDPITVSATFVTVPGGGPNHVRFATIESPNQNLTVTIHNYDYFLSN